MFKCISSTNCPSLFKIWNSQIIRKHFIVYFGLLRMIFKSFTTCKHRSPTFDDIYGSAKDILFTILFSFIFYQLSYSQIKEKIWLWYLSTPKNRKMKWTKNRNFIPSICSLKNQEDLWPPNLRSCLAQLLIFLEVFF